MQYTSFNNIQEIIQELKYFSGFNDKSNLILRFQKYLDIAKDFENNEASPGIIAQLKQSYQELQDYIKHFVDTFDAEIAVHFIEDLNSEIGLVKEDIVSKQCHHCDTSVDQLKLHILKIILRSTKELSAKELNNNGSSVFSNDNIVGRPMAKIQIKETTCIGEEGIAMKNSNQIDKSNTIIPFTNPQGKLSEVDKIIIKEIFSTKDYQLVNLCLDYFGPSLLYFLDDQGNSIFDRLSEFFPNEEIRMKIEEKLKQVETKEMSHAYEGKEAIITYILDHNLAPELLNVLLTGSLPFKQDDVLKITELSVIGTDQQNDHSTPIIEQPSEDSLIELSHSFLDKGVKIEELSAVMGLGAKNQASALEEKALLELLGQDDISFY